MSDDFLSRWSRRKLEARKAEPTGEPPTIPPVEPSSPAQVAPIAPAPGPDEPGLTPEEIAKLPKVDDLTAESDLSAFLRKGVPDALRNAALRKMWALDPGIRDFVGHARDYAYDWNAAGGVPGTGALLPTDDVQSMVRQVFGAELAPSLPAAQDDRSPGGETLLPSGAAGGQSSQPDPAAPEDDAGAAPNSIGPQSSVSAECASARADAPPQPAGPESGAAAGLRRHGGAKPH